jgi:hypothetical protein
MKQRHRAALVDRNTVIFPTNVCHPDEIIESVKGEMATGVQTYNDNQIEDEIPTNATSIVRAKSESTSQRNLCGLLEMPCAGYLCSYKSYYPVQKKKNIFQLGIGRAHPPSHYSWSCRGVRAPSFI